MELVVPLAIAAIAAMSLGLGAILEDRRARVRRWAEQEGEDFEAVVPLLHSINNDRCIGCEACVDACPTEVLDLVDHKVNVARFGDCVQCEQCANACPTQALVMYREGTTPRMLTVPELDDHFQTGLPGQYLIGEVAGKPLVKNAANLGRAVIEHLARELAQRPGPGGDVLDVIIVGSGPGGLSAGLTCVRRKLSFLVLEKEHVISSTVARYPKGKHFMAEPATTKNVSYLPVFDATKEELVAAWQRVVEAVAMPVRLGEAVEKVSRGDDGIFRVKTTVGSYRARAVVLATGLRGKPRLLAVPGANLEKVQSLLDDPDEMTGQDVLVVGGGDSAVEGAMSLADAGARVILSYRGDGFKRCKQGNQKRLAEMVSAGKLTLHLESNVTEFTEREVKLKLKDGQVVTAPNQRAFVLIGADTPVAWLEANNVRFVERPHLYALGSTEDAVRRVAPDAAECPRELAEVVARVQGHAAPKATGHRVRSVVEHLVDDLFDVVTSVSEVFHLEPEELTRSGRAMTDNAHLAATVAGKGLQVGERIVPVARLTQRAATPAPVAHPGRRTEPVAHLGRRTEPVAHLGRRTEPVAHLGRHTEPVAHLGRHTSALRTLARAVTPLPVPGPGQGTEPMPHLGEPASRRAPALSPLSGRRTARAATRGRHTDAVTALVQTPEAPASRAPRAEAPRPAAAGPTTAASAPQAAPPPPAAVRSAAATRPPPAVRPAPPARPSAPAVDVSGVDEPTSLEDPRTWLDQLAP